ncbi:MAG TPA: HAMP domain-containing sensor histidine kinase [Acidimicrobiales bacterium]|nr:HAMP domain-containing sensor histidine kinase [Acidimicrobiales bacterium]
MRRWVLGIAAFHVALAAVLLANEGSWSPGGSLAALGGCAAAFALVGLVPMHLELRRHACTVVLTEAVLVVALLHLGPVGVVLAAASGEALACVVSRQRRLKVVFNVAGTCGAAAVAAVVFAHMDSRLLHPWSAAVLAGVSAYVVTSMLTTSAILAVAEHRRFVGVLLANAATVAVASAASASVGLSAVALGEVSTAGPVLLAPLLALVFLGTRRMALQSAEHMRFQRLYEASARTAQLAGFEDALATLAGEARGLVTGFAAICCGQKPDGEWVGVLVDDTGASPAGPEVVAALVALPGDKPQAVPLSQGSVLSQAMPQATDLVWAPPRPGTKGKVHLAVFREIGPDEQAEARSEVLGAFSGHAALTVANALLYQEVEEALLRQIDLTHQKGEFLATVSHELRTPLTCVLGAVSTIRRCQGRLGPEDVDRMLQTALDQGDRLKRLIEDLLQVASAEHGEMRPELRMVDLDSLIGSIVSDLSAPGLRLRAEVEAGCGGLRTDEHKLRQIITNLVENGVKYAPEGGIEVRASLMPTLNGVEIRVVDHGSGIPEADRERVFERFVQLDQSSTRRRGGTGLGLYLCRQLAGLLGGSLTLEATAGGGSTFLLTLPWQPAGTPAGETSAVIAAEHSSVLRPPALTGR